MSKNKSSLGKQINKRPSYFQGKKNSWQAKLYITLLFKKSKKCNFYCILSDHKNGISKNFSAAMIYFNNFHSHSWHIISSLVNKRQGGGTYWRVNDDHSQTS